MFSGRDRRPVGHTADTRRWKALLAQADVPDARLHDARHTAATMMLMQGVPARVVMEILGHSTVLLTMETYSHVVPEFAADAAAKIERGLTG